ncbi:MAG TPA: sulfite exporter TauE/SafE family protein [Xanthobacteraceae bacterium]
MGYLAPLGLAVAAVLIGAQPALAQTAAPVMSALPWWVWVLLLLVVTFALGLIAVVAGVGGGVLFVPIISGLFPFHLDFVRGTGLLIALAGALAAGPTLLRGGLASLQLALPPALIASAAAILGANLGLNLPEQVAQLALGTVIMGVVALMLIARKSSYPEVPAADALAVALRMHGIYHDPFNNRDVKWHVHRTPQGLALFVLIGVLAGMFGIGAGWANVPVLNLVMGAPLKVSVGTSSLILSIVDSAAAWIYLNHGAMLAIIAVPSMLGMMLGSTIGVGLLTRANVAVVRKLVIGLLLLAGMRALLRGVGV